MTPLGYDAYEAYDVIDAYDAYDAYDVFMFWKGSPSSKKATLVSKHLSGLTEKLSVDNSVVPSVGPFLRSMTICKKNKVVYKTSIARHMIFFTRHVRDRPTAG